MERSRLQQDDDIAIAMIVARARNGVIGKDGDLPWRLKSDMAWFVEHTRGKPVIMGRKTWESLPKKPLPGRANIVVSRNADYTAPGAQIAFDVETALTLGLAEAKKAGADEVMIIGGQALYEAGLPVARRLYVSRVEADIKGDAYFPDFSTDEWRCVYARRTEAGEGDDYAFEAQIWERDAD